MQFPPLGGGTLAEKACDVDKSCAAIMAIVAPTTAASNGFMMRRWYAP